MKVLRSGRRCRCVPGRTHIIVLNLALLSPKFAPFYPQQGFYRGFFVLPAESILAHWLSSDFVLRKGFEFFRLIVPRLLDSASAFMLPSIPQWPGTQVINTSTFACMVVKWKTVVAIKRHYWVFVIEGPSASLVNVLFSFGPLHIHVLAQLTLLKGFGGDFYVPGLDHDKHSMLESRCIST